MPSMLTHEPACCLHWRLVERDRCVCLQDVFETMPLVSAADVARLRVDLTTSRETLRKTGGS